MTTPTITQQLAEALRWILAVPDCKITSPQREKAREALARFDAAKQATGEQGLPVRDEREAFEEWAGSYSTLGLDRDSEGHYRSIEQEMLFDAWQARAAIPQPAPEAQQGVVVPQGATHYQPHQKAYYKRVSATEWFLWSDRHGWMPSKGTSDNSQWVTLEKLDTKPEPPQPAQAAPLTDEQIDAICAPGRKARWNNDGRQYDRDTFRLAERAHGIGLREPKP